MEALGTRIDIAFIRLPATLAGAESPDWIRETLRSPRGGETWGCDPSLISSVSPALLSRPELLSRAQPVPRGALPAAPTEASGVPSLPFSSLSPKDRAQSRGLLPEPRVDTWHRNLGGAFSPTSTHGLTGSEASLFIPLWLHWVFAAVQAFSS